MDLSGTNHWGQNNIQNDAKQSQSKSNLQVTDEENKQNGELRFHSDGPETIEKLTHKRTVSNTMALNNSSIIPSQPDHDSASSQSRISSLAEDDSKLLKKNKPISSNNVIASLAREAAKTAEPTTGGEVLEQTNQQSVPNFVVGGITSRKNSAGQVFEKKEREEEEKVDDDSQLIDSGKGSPRGEQLSDTVKATTSPRLNNSQKQSLPPTKTGKSLFDDLSEQESVSKENKECSCTKKQIQKFIDNKYMVIWMTLLTIYALFFDDIRIIAFTKKEDDIFFSLSVVALFFFILEVVLSSIAVPGYICAFFFWLDILATISIIPDIGWIWDPLLGQFTGANSAASVAKTSRASRAARIIRFVRLIRLIRLVKLYKQAKLAQQKLHERRERQQKQSIAQSDPKQMHHAPSTEKEKQDNLNRGHTIEVQSSKDVRHKKSHESIGKRVHSFMGGIDSEVSEHYVSQKPFRPKGANSHLPSLIASNIGAPDGSSQFGLQHKTSRKDSGLVVVEEVNESNMIGEEKIEIPSESRISKKLSELTTKRVILLSLLLIFFLPLFNSDTYVEAERSYDISLQMLYDLQSTALAQSATTRFIEDHQNLDYKLLRLILTDSNLYEINQFSELRSSEIAEVQISESPLTVVAYSQRYYLIRESIINIARTIFVAAVLAIASIEFSRLAQNLVLNPIERMIEKVKVIADNPLAAIDEEEMNRAGLHTVAEQEDGKKEKKHQKKKKCCCITQEDDQKQQHETVILERTIIKIGQLLAIGFGEAGSQIIADNMAQGGDLTLQGSGNKMYAIFGFCDIRQFTDTTEVLQTEVMVFVNQVAQVVHSMVDRFQGSANKNIGDAFLLVWKFDEKKGELLQDDDGLVINRNSHSAQQRADMSIIAFLKIIAKVNKLTHLVEYSRDERILQRMPNYKVRMGFGLHSGWAIEGAIGSEFKIDASYLSPNVNMASRLEAATKQYGVPLLISGPLLDICTEDMKRIARQIDIVTVKGSKTPLRLYTVDIDESEFVEVKDRYSGMTPNEKKQKRLTEKRELKMKMQTLSTQDYFNRDQELFFMRNRLDLDFMEVFEHGFDDYLNGDWSSSKQHLNQVLSMKPNDGPSKTLLNYMAEFDFHSPASWPGFRELTEK